PRSSPPCSDVVKTHAWRQPPPWSSCGSLTIEFKLSLSTRQLLKFVPSCFSFPHWLRLCKQKDGLRHKSMMCLRQLLSHQGHAVDHLSAPMKLTDKA
uniref:Uncharacterized protein n=1 Tax=Aegilops tauschii subsp. strangulata TaxID=200361 RepID=A0A453S7C6_AEGTS